MTDEKRRLRFKVLKQAAERLRELAVEAEVDEWPAAAVEPLWTASDTVERAAAVFADY